MKVTACAVSSRIYWETYSKLRPGSLMKRLRGVERLGFGAYDCQDLHVRGMSGL